MDRILTFVGQEIYEWSISKQPQNDMVGLATLSSAIFPSTGASTGLPCTQTTVPSMQVAIGAGALYQLAALEATIAGTLPVDTTDQILKQGILLSSAAPVLLPNASTFATPGTVGQSINYLIEAQYQDQDVSIDPTTGLTPVTLNFYNSANPTTPWNGPNNTGASSNTFRKGVIAWQVKAGTAATTGTQTTPAPDSGWLGMWVVTVAYGQSTVLNANISRYSGSPNMPYTLRSAVGNSLQIAVVTGASSLSASNAGETVIITGTGAYATTLPTAASMPASGGCFRFVNQNTAACTVIVSGSDVFEVSNGTIFVTSSSVTLQPGDTLSVETDGVNHWYLTGGSAAIMGRLINVQKLTASTTYVPTPGTTSIVFEMVGGGGAGGGSPSGIAASSWAMGSAGGPGAYAKHRTTLANLASYTVTIGAGGVGASGTSGGVGGATSFGGITCGGGGGGGTSGSIANNTFAILGSGIAGALSGTVTPNILGLTGQIGQPGLGAIITNVIAGIGGNTPLGSGGEGVVSTVGVGSAGTGYGSGGGGSAGQNGSAAQTGASGAPGVVIIYEYS